MRGGDLRDVVAANLARVRTAVAAACDRSGRDPDEVRLVAVTKTRDPADLAALAAVGLADYGENRVDHLEAMAAARPPGSTFHFIGRVQGRQFRRLVPHCAVLHSLARPDHVPRLARACEAAGRRLEVFCQVNTAGEAQKAGCAPEALPGLLDAVYAAESLRPVGLMCMAPFTGEEAPIRACFAACRELARRHGLPRLSMGMTNDYVLAVEEGATDLRLGTVLYREGGDPPEEGR